MDNLFVSNQDIITYSDLKRPNPWICIRSVKGEYWNNSGLRDAAVIFVLEGSITVSYEASGDRLVKRGEMFFLPPMCSHIVCAREDSLAVTCFFQISQPLCRIYHLEDLAPLCEGVEDIYIHYAIPDIMTGFLWNVKKYIDSGINNHYLYDTVKEEAIHLLFISFSKQELAAFFYPIIGEDMEFKNFIMNNFLSVKNVQELAALANYSTSGFIKKFHRYFNESPYRWMQRHKAKRILQELLNRNRPLKDIAIEFNFSTYQHFSDFCKVHFGQPPTRISKKSCKSIMNIYNHIGKDQVE